MTQVHIRLVSPTDGTTPITGRILFAPSSRVDLKPSIMLPVGNTLSLDENGEMTATLEPTGVDWCWRISELMSGGTTRYVAVPDSETMLEYDALTDVDPASLKPSVATVPAWTNAVTKVQALADASSASATSASASETNATNAAASAMESRTMAAASASSASVDASHAASSATSAAASASSIGNQLAQAQTAAADASSSKASASQSAQAAAQSAQAAATSQEAAQDNATTAVSAAGQATSAAASAQQASTTATTAVAKMPMILTAANESAAMTLSSENPNAWVFYPEAA